MAEKQFELEGIGTVRVLKRRGSRSIRMSFASNGDVRVSIPAWAPFNSGLKFALERQGWLQKHKPASTAPYQEGMRIGKAHRLYFIKSPSGTKPSVRVTPIKIRITYPITASIFDKDVQAAAERGAKKALSAEATHLLPQRLRDLATAHGFSFRSVHVKQLKTRWGSCDQNRDIILNYYLMQLPWNLIDYVLLHELTHTEHLNHSEDFWARFDQALPGARQIRKQLKPYRTSVLPLG
jgi:predicted metal-dependent hydrolase